MIFYLINYSHNQKQQLFYFKQLLILKIWLEANVARHSEDAMPNPAESPFANMLRQTEYEQLLQQKKVTGFQNLSLLLCYMLNFQTH